ncbi:MAG: PKD domain-containing protein [Saprospiraceae bacterium]|nr:PKD domain-containing protein [Saprospiraceae bacterium]
MKTIFQLILGVWLLLAVFSCGEELKEIASVQSPAVTTGNFDPADMTVAGQLTALGDGIVQHGHVWSSTNNPPTTADNTTELGATTSTGSFTSELELLEPNATHYIRAYAIDVHGRTFYGEVILINPTSGVTAAFTFPNQDYKAPATVVFTNNSVNANTYKWYVDNDFQANTQHFTHKFMLPGTYNVKLVVSGDLGKDSVTNDVNVSWNTFLLTKAEYGEAKKIVLLDNGNTLILAKRASGQNSGIVLLKLDVFGNTIGEYLFNDLPNSEPYDMIKLSDGTIAIVGSVLNTSVNNSDGFYLRVDTIGNKLRGPISLSLSPNNSSEIAYSVTQTPTGYVLVAGRVNNPIAGDFDVFIASGQPASFGNSFGILPQRISLPDNEIGYAVVADAGNNIWIAGSKGAPGSHTDAMLMKIDEFGTLAAGYPKTFGTGEFEVASTITALPGNSFMLSGRSAQDIYLVQVNSSGSAIAPYPRQIDGGGLEFAYALIAQTDGSYVLGGIKDGNAMLVKISNNNQINWIESFGSVGDDYFRSAVATPDGGFLAAGVQNGSLYIVKTNDLGKTQ